MGKFVVKLALLLPWFPVTQTRRSEDQQLTTELGKRSETLHVVVNVTLSIPVFSVSVHVLVGVYLLGKTCAYTGVTSSVVSCHADSAK